MKTKNRTLQYQFRVWTVLFVIVPSLLVMVIYTLGQIKLSKEQNLELISQRVSSQKRLIEHWITERANTIHEISQLDAFKALDEEQMTRTFYIMQQGTKNFDALTYVDKNGIFKISTTISPNLLGQQYVRGPIIKADFISDVFLGQTTGSPLIIFSSPVYDATGNFQGLVLGAVKTETLITLLHDNLIGKTGEVLLVNREGTMLTEPRNRDNLIKKGLIETTAVMHLKIPPNALENIKLGQTGTATWVDYNNEKVLSAYQDMPERHWTLIGKINEEEVFAPIYKQLAMMTCGTLLIILFILPLSAIIITPIKRPLDWLRGQATLVATKNYELIGRGMRSRGIPQELLVLCTTFVKMSHKIQNTVHLLKKNETQLENKVAERTKALSAINHTLKEEIIKHQATNNALINSQAALSNSELRYKNLFDHMSTGCSYYKVIFDEEQFPIDLEYVNVNRAYEKSAGKSASHLIGKRLTSIVPNINEEKFNWMKAYIDVAISRKPVSFTQYFQHHQCWYSISAYSPMKNFVAIISEDVTHYTMLKKEVARMDRLNLIGNMAAGLAHEIRNPLTVIKGYLQYFKKKLPESLHDRLALVLSELARIETIITDFLSIAKQKPTELALQDLNLIINSIAPLLLTNARKREMNIDFKLAKKLPAKLLAEKEIKQLILNLAMNGLDAMKKHGTLVIETQVAGTSVILSIKDCGAGIPKELQQKIFDPFFTTRDEGTGLGLSICASIIERHHGTIKISSEKGIGTRFTITFQE